MRVICVNATGASDLVVGQEYEVVGENGRDKSDYFLQGVRSSWSKSRFKVATSSMTFEEYQQWAHGRLRHEKSRLICREPFVPPGTPNPLTLTLASFAHMTEAGEAGDNVKKFVFHGKEWDEIKPKLLLELGDDLWYFAVKLKECGITLQEVIDANVAKLEARDGKQGEKFHDRKI